MPRPRRKTLVRDAPLTPVPAEILDQFVQQGPIFAEELDLAVRRCKKALIERALGRELTHHRCKGFSRTWMASRSRPT